MELLTNIKNAIIKSGRTYKEVAGELGITYNGLWRLLTGRRKIKAAMVAKIALLMKKSLNDLYGDITKYSV